VPHIDSNALARKALEKLPPNFRGVFILRELERMSYKEIEEITSMPVGIELVACAGAGFVRF
jgi:DNA-directed RNA polymerase specialized sigma24 family protein